MRLAGIVVGGLNGGEDAFEAAAFEHGRDAPPGLAGGEPEDPAIDFERGQRLASAGKQRFLTFMLQPQGGEGLLVAVGDPAMPLGFVAGQQRRHRLDQRQADDASHGLRTRHLDPMRAARRRHRLDDVVLAVDQGAVDVEDGKTKAVGHAADVRQSKTGRVFPVP